MREEHRKLNGVVLPVNAKEWDAIYPPNGWRCSCRVKPLMKAEGAGIDFRGQRMIVEEYMKSGEYKSSKKSGFGVNRAITGYVFAENQNYVSMLDTNKTLVKMDYEKWKQPPMDDLEQKSTAQIQPFEGNPEQWYEANKAIESNFRKYEIPEKVFQIHTTGKYAKGENNRIPLLNSIKETINTPDEIWQNIENGKSIPNNRTYIKFYNGQTIAVVTKLNKEVIEIHSWYIVSKKAENKVRVGLLIKKAAQE